VQLPYTWIIGGVMVDVLASSVVDPGPD